MPEAKPLSVRLIRSAAVLVAWLQIPVLLVAGFLLPVSTLGAAAVVASSLAVLAALFAWARWEERHRAG